MNGRASKKSEVSWMLHILPLPKIVELWKSCCFHFEKRNKEITKKTTKWSNTNIAREHRTRNNGARTSRTFTKAIKSTGKLLFFTQSFLWRPAVFVDFPILSHCHRLEWITQCTCQINNAGLTVGRGLGWKSTLTTVNGTSPWKNVWSFKVTAIQAQDLYSRELSCIHAVAGTSLALLPTWLEFLHCFYLSN